MRVPGVLLLILFTSIAAAADTISVKDGWVRAMPPVARNSAGYLDIRNEGARDDVLLAARVQGARVTEMHEMVQEGGAMSMKRRPEIVVRAGATVRFSPGGLHLMLIDLQKPLQLGQRLDAVLQFRDAGEVRVVLDVR